MGVMQDQYLRVGTYVVPGKDGSPIPEFTIESKDENRIE